MAGVLAVAFSAVLMAVQGGVLVGLVATVSAPVDDSPADIWIGAKHTPSADNGGPIDRRFRNRLHMHPGIERTDEYIQEFTRWWNPKAGTVLVILCGLNLNPNGIGPLSLLSPELQIALSEPGAVAIDREDKSKLGIEKAGEVAEIHGQHVRVVGFLDDMASMTGCYVFCSAPTARKLIHYRQDQTTYLLATVKDPSDRQSVIKDLRSLPDVDVFSKNEFSAKSRWYWILQTKSGLAVGFTAVLGLIVGAVVTSQTLYAATASMLRELAVLKSLGVPSWRMNFFVVEQSAVIGVIGLLLALPLSLAAEYIGNTVGTKIQVAPALMGLTVIIILAMSLLSGAVALRSLSRVDPAELLR